MFSEKNLPKLIIITPIVTVIAFAALMNYFFIHSQYDNFAKEVRLMEEEYLSRQKTLLKNENHKVHDYIAYQREMFVKRLHEQLRQHMVQLELYGDEGFKRTSSVNGRFVFSFDPLHDEVHGYPVVLLGEDLVQFKKALHRILGTKKRAFGEVILASMPIERRHLDVYIKQDETSGVLNGVISFRYDEEQLLKQEVINWMDRIRYGTNGYIWVHDTSHHLVAHPFRKESIGKDDTNNTDATGALIFQQYIQIATTQKEGDFVEYYWARPDFGEPAKKIGFVKLDPVWQWVIGTGLYVDDIEATIAKRRAQLEEEIEKYIQIVIITALTLAAFLGGLSLVMSQTIVQVFKEYREKVSAKEQSLKEVNKTLAVKIQEAVKDAKQKDRALLQQSRLAQMGEMISMIAHQWRQPLSEISGMLMEIKTAAKFGKADRAYIEKEVEDGDRLIAYMSQTIDDFRNFFKPAKVKEHFWVADACKEAITLAEATLKHQQIQLRLHVKDNGMIAGYPSEYAQVVLNLLLNSKDALVERGVKEPCIEVVVSTTDTEMIVIVRDNGGGIEERFLERIFEPYFSTKKGVGTGLGLYMSKMIIEENMGGELSVANKEMGAEFRIKVKRERSDV